MVQTFVFVIITMVLAWLTNYVPVLSLVTLVSFGLVAFMLIMVFALSQGGQLSERTVREVVKSAFKFITRRGK